MKGLSPLHLLLASLFVLCVKSNAHTPPGSKHYCTRHKHDLKCMRRIESMDEKFRCYRHKKLDKIFCFKRGVGVK